jgi:exoribonuclease II
LYVADPPLRPGSLVLYKNEPARITGVERKKITIARFDGASLSVRPKDVTLLHPGPVDSLSALRLPEGEPQIAWELLAGSTTTLPELAELAYEAYTPASAWATWQLLADGLYFSGTPEAVVAHTPAEVEAEKQSRAARAAAEAAWQAFLQRLEQGTFDAGSDVEFLQEVEALALARYEQSRVLRALGRAETPESAHALLLEVGYWQPEFNPYPLRLGLDTTIPAHPLPPLPEEPRLDLTHLAAFAIDDAGSDDPDDAFSLDGERLWVHVADVAALVPPDSPADLEARARGASLYLPEGTVPMLPLDATERLALGLADTSPALSIGFCLDGDGAVTDVHISPSWVGVTRLSYAAADSLLAGASLAPFWSLLQQRAARRAAAGAIDIDLPEVKIRVHDGEITIRPLPNLRSRQMVLEAMLAAGEAVASYALEHNDSHPLHHPGAAVSAGGLAGWHGRAVRPAPHLPAQPGCCHPGSARRPRAAALCPGNQPAAPLPGPRRPPAAKGTPPPRATARRAGDPDPHRRRRSCARRRALRRTAGQRTLDAALSCSAIPGGREKPWSSSNTGSAASC